MYWISGNSSPFSKSREQKAIVKSTLEDCEFQGSSRFRDTNRLPYSVASFQIWCMCGQLSISLHHHVRSFRPARKYPATNSEYPLIGRLFSCEVNFLSFSSLVLSGVLSWSLWSDFIDSFASQKNHPSGLTLGSCFSPLWFLPRIPFHFRQIATTSQVAV